MQDLALTKLFLGSFSKSGGIGVEGEGKSVQREKMLERAKQTTAVGVRSKKLNSLAFAFTMPHCNCHLFLKLG